MKEAKLDRAHPEEKLFTARRRQRTNGTDSWKEEAKDRGKGGEGRFTDRVQAWLVLRKYYKFITCSNPNFCDK